MAVSVEEKREAALFVWYTMPSIHREGGTDLGDILEPHGLHFLEPALPQDAQHLKSTHDRGGEMELVGQSVARYSKCFLPKTQIGQQRNKQTNKQTNKHTHLLKAPRPRVEQAAGVDAVHQQDARLVVVVLCNGP